MRSTEQQSAALGIEAAQVLENPAFKEAIERMRADCVAQWMDCPIRDKEGQMLIKQAAMLTEKVVSTLVGLIEQGKLAKARLDINEARDESTLRRGLRSATGR